MVDPQHNNDDSSSDSPQQQQQESGASTPLPSYRHSTISPSPLNPQRSAGTSLPALGARSEDAPRRSSTEFLTSSSDGSDGLDSITRAVEQGAIGGAFGPFPRSSSYYSGGAQAPFLHRDARRSSTSLLDPQKQQPDTSAMPSLPYRLNSSYSSSGESLHDAMPPAIGAGYRSSAVLESNRLFAEQDDSLLWNYANKEGDDYLHDWSKADDERFDRQIHLFSSRGCLDGTLLAVIVIVIVGLFAGWPIYSYVINGRFPNEPGTRMDLGGWGPGGINGSSQVPLIPGLPTLIDKDTPMDARTIEVEGQKLNLVFSDEFNVEGRTFWPGDDPFWEAFDLHYWGTNDLEWYDPDAVTTKGGNLEIVLSQEPSHGLNFRSGMLQSWNKLCFTGGYLEMRMSMPGTPFAMGAWPGAWTMGNLGRAGYGATNHGVWPYSYNACDVGTMPNQTYANKTGPAAALHSGDRGYGGTFSYQPGQRLSACTCESEDHPGPSVNVGRGAPEIDLVEGQVDWSGVGSSSQSLQIQPSSAGYHWLNVTPHTTIFNASITTQNPWVGSVNQQSASVITLTDKTSFEGAGYLTQGFLYEPGAEGRVMWNVDRVPSWQILASAFPPDPETEISSINLNLAISNAFQPPQWGKLQFPMTFRIDYVRIFQKGDPQVSCDPPSHPTSDYINRHLDVYNNANLTMWTKPWPKNRLAEGGCA